MSNLTILPFNLPGKIYRSPMPYGFFDYGETTFAEYQQAEINTVVILTSDEEAHQHAKQDLRALYQKEGMEVIHLPIGDHDVHQDDQAMEDALMSAIAEAQAGRNLVVHCYAGIGRTGTFLALMARRVLGLGGQEAISFVRAAIPGAIETKDQVRIIIEDEGKN